MNIRSFFSSKRKIVVSVLTVIALVLIGNSIFFSKSKNQNYQTSKAEKGTLVVSISSSGQVGSTNSSPVTTGVTGVVSDIYAANGDFVNAGDSIAEVLPDQQSLQKKAQAWSSYLSAQSSLNSAQAKINSLQSALFKTNQAFVTDRGVVNPSKDQKDDPRYIEENAEWLQAEADYKNQQTVINAAQQSVNSTWLSYQQVSGAITAPISGTLTGFSLQLGQVIPAQTSSSTTSTTTNSFKVATIKTDSAPTIIVSLSEVDAPQVKVGNKVTLTFDALPGKTYVGKVLSVDTSGTVSSGVTTYPAVITLDSAGSEILPNMSATANIITKTKDNVVLIPNAAAQTQNGQPTVRVLKKGQIQEVDVEIGDSSDTQTEIISGVNEGDEVVVGTITTTQRVQSGTSPFGLRGGFGQGALRPGGGGR